MVLGSLPPPGVQLPGPPHPPTRLVAMNSEFRVGLHGVVGPEATLPGAVSSPQDHFVTDASVKLRTGWLAFEVYPLGQLENWRPDLAPLWAETYLANAVAQSFAHDTQLTVP